MNLYLFKKWIEENEITQYELKNKKVLLSKKQAYLIFRKISKMNIIKSFYYAHIKKKHKEIMISKKVK
jgi:hypothetical protein